MKKRLAVALAAAGLVSTLTLAGCSSPSDSPTKGELVYITNTPIGQNVFLQLGKKGIEETARAVDASAKTFESTDSQSRRANIEAALAESPKVIVLITFDFADLAEEYAKSNPDQQFLLIDACPAAPPANLHCAVFREYEGAYLLGVEAAMLSKTGRVGTVGAVDNPFLHRYTDGFAGGAKSVNPSIGTSQLFIGGDNPFSDPARAKEQALAMIQSNADMLFAAAAGSNQGVFEAAASAGVFAFGNDINQCPDAPGHVVDNMTKEINVIILDQVKKILAGKATPSTAYGLAEGGLSLTSLGKDAASSQCVVMEHPEVIDAVKKVRQQIIDGKVKVADPSA